MVAGKKSGKSSGNITRADLEKIENRLEKIEGRLKDINRRIVASSRYSSETTDAWKVTSIILAAVLIIWAFGLFTGVFNSGTGSSSGKTAISQEKIRTYLQLQIDRGVPLKDAVSELVALGVERSVVEKVASQVRPAKEEIKSEQEVSSSTNEESKDKGKPYSVEIIEYSDFQCPFCGRAFRTMKQLKEEYGDKIHIIFKHFPLSFHQYAQKAAEAAECARDQGKFWEMHDRLFENQRRLSVDDLREHAKAIGLDMDRFNECLDSGEKKSVVDADFKEGQRKGVTGTPAFFIEGEKIVGAQPIDRFREIIDRKLKEKGDIRAETEDKEEETVLERDESEGIEKKSDKIKIYEFADFQCPFCERFYTTTYKDIKEKYGDKVEFVFKHFPLGFHQYAQKAAEAAECARDQGKFWGMHDRLFENQDKLTVDDLREHAEAIGLDMDRFNECLDSGEKKSVVDADFKEGQRKGVTGTPTFFIGDCDDPLVGAQPLSAFEEFIQAQLEGKCPGDDDPEVDLLVLNDNTCDECNRVVDQIVSLTRRSIFKKLNVEKIDYNSERGKKLAEELDLVALPAFIFKEGVEKAYKFSQIEKALDKKEGTSLGTIYLIKSSAIGAPKRLKLPSVDDDAYIGKEDAPVTIIEFADYQCPFCAKAQDTVKKVLEIYGDYVRFVFRDFPLTSIHPYAQKAAEAAECARDQGKFWEMHDRLFENQRKLSVDDLREHAKAIGLDMDKFNECLDSNKYEDEVKKDFEDGQKYGVSGTPAFFIGSYSISGAQPFEKFQEIIDKVLREKGITPPAVPTPTPNPEFISDKPGVVKIVEFSDFQCPFCGRAYKTVKKIKEEYGDKVEIVFKHFPLNFHQYAQKAAEAAECARDQGKFWEMHDRLFENQDKLTVDDLREHAKAIGLDMDKFNSCLDNGEKEAVVKADMDEGIELGVQGTPHFFINGEVISGAQPYESFKQVIDKYLGEGE